MKITLRRLTVYLRNNIEEKKSLINAKSELEKQLNEHKKQIKKIEKEHDNNEKI